MTRQLLSQFLIRDIVADKYIDLLKGNLVNQADREHLKTVNLIGDNIEDTCKNFTVKFDKFAYRNGGHTLWELAFHDASEEYKKLKGNFDVHGYDFDEELSKPAVVR